MLKEGVWKIVWSRQCKYSFCRFSAIFYLRRFYVCVTFIIEIVDFYKIERIRFNITVYVN
jgi:hypothetical protein